MKNETPQDEEKPVIDLGTNAEFKTIYKTIRLSNGKSHTIVQREIIEPELPERKKAFRRGPGRPKKKTEPVAMKDDPKLDIDSLFEQAKDKVED